MSKGLKPGYLYILNDVDQRTGNSSPYYKIGITFESKTVEERIKEHRTARFGREIKSQNYGKGITSANSYWGK